MYTYAGLSCLWLQIFLWKTQEITEMQKHTRNPNSLCITVTSIISWIWLAQKYCRKCFFLWYFCFLCQKSGSITQRHTKMREESVLGWVMGALNFCFLWLFPSLQWWELKGQDGRAALSTQGCTVPLWGGWAVGALGSLLIALSLLAEKLISLRCFFAASGQFLFSVNLPDTHIQLHKHPGGWATPLCVL